MLYSRLRRHACAQPPMSLLIPVMRPAVMNNLAIFSGNAHPQLAKDICRELDIALGQAQVFEFTNENIFVKIDENVRGCDV
ncbi:MAG TPA: ribose-phosphate pyrophosphokinase-like domain-containing protein, partial [Ktedonobacterales bacterium]